jgi:hypothetical protein
MASIEATIFFSNRIFVYDLRNARNVEQGYRAADYSSTPHMWAGQLRVNSGQDAEGNERNHVILEHDPADAGKNGTFARCEIKPGVIQDAIDSSRYFVLRLDNEQTGQYIMLLIGFPNKAHAFDFKHELASLAQKKRQVIPQDFTDYSLKEDKISLDINNLRGKQPLKAQDAPQTVSRPTNVEKVTLSSASMPTRGRRTNNAGGAPGTPQQSTGIAQQSLPQQQQQQPQQSQQQQQTQQNTQPKVDIFADFLGGSPSQSKPQQQQNSGNNMLDAFFTSNPTSSNAPIATRQTSTSAIPAQQQQTKAKSDDPFDFDDFNF